MALNKGADGFNKFAAGTKHYGGGRAMPNIGKVSGEGKVGYAKRNRLAKAAKNRLRGLQ